MLHQYAVTSVLPAKRVFQTSRALAGIISNYVYSMHILNKNLPHFNPLHTGSFAFTVYYFLNTGIKSFSFLCRQQHIAGQKVSTNCRMSALPDCFPSSSCLLLREFWNLVPNNTNIHVKETKI